jgi:2-oxo-4-hydroxy-4-carboxy-5-ureidoimidazoline decarboxylase
VSDDPALARLNAAAPAARERELLDLCGSRRWARRVSELAPFADRAALAAAAERAFDGLGEEDWLEALAAHPRLGERSSGAQSARGDRWSAGEQAGVGGAEEAFAAANRRYETRFGRAFVARAAGRDAGELLGLLEERLGLEPPVELARAAAEQRQITGLRIDRMLEDARLVSGLSTHVLDLVRGRPAVGVAVLLERREERGWRELAAAATDDDGRVAALLPAGEPLIAGGYRLNFALADYFARHGVECFFPEATLAFEVREPARHHHVPLLVGPFGYTTYRGS